MKMIISPFPLVMNTALWGSQNNGFVTMSGRTSTGIEGRMEFVFQELEQVAWFLLSCSLTEFSLTHISQTGPGFCGWSLLCGRRCHPL